MISAHMSLSKLSSRNRSVAQPSASTSHSVPAVASVSCIAHPEQLRRRFEVVLIFSHPQFARFAALSWSSGFGRSCPPKGGIPTWRGGLTSLLTLFWLLVLWVGTLLHLAVRPIAAEDEECALVVA